MLGTCEEGDPVDDAMVLRLRLSLARVLLLAAAAMATRDSGVDGRWVLRLEAGESFDLPFS